MADSNQDIDEWIAERKRKFPTKSAIKQKIAAETIEQKRKRDREQQHQTTKTLEFDENEDGQILETAATAAQPEKKKKAQKLCKYYSKGTCKNG